MVLVSEIKSDPAEVYAALRRRGQIWVSAEEYPVVGSLRRLAVKDGLRVSQYRRSAKGLSRNQAAHRPYSVCLTDEDGVNIVAPDREQS